MVMAKEKALDKKQTMSLLDNFLQKFQNLCNQQNPPQISDLEKMVAPNFQNMSNGREIGKSRADLLKRIEKLRGKYSNIKIKQHGEVLISDNKAIIQYDLDVNNRNGQKSQLTLMAIATIEDNLITQWNQVSHEKGRDHLD